MSITAIVRPELEYRKAVLHCRFVIGAFPTADQLEKAKYEAGNRFIADMAKQGWDFLGTLAMVGGPWPATQIATSVPKAPPLRERRRGPHPTAPDNYPSLKGIVNEVPTIYTAESWEYEIAGAFVRKLAPLEVLETAKPAIEALDRRRRSKRHGHG